MKFETTAQYRKDIKRIKKQGLDLSLLNEVILTLIKTITPSASLP